MSHALHVRDRDLRVHGGGPSDFVMTAADFGRIAAMLQEDAGIHLGPSKATLVYSRLAKRLRSLGLDSFQAYCTLVGADDGAEERRHMMAALTTNVTRFFREPHHFDHLRTQVLPPLLEAARRGGRVRLWSAACSSGEEPYSIALTILALMPDAASFDVKVLATDINPGMVTHGRRGVYEDTELRDVPAELKARWFTAATDDCAGSWRAADELRALVTFRELNLIGNWPMRGAFQAIFCRNVVIYFDDETQSRVWGRIIPLLASDGCLYIGHSERVSGPAADALRSEAITTYRRRNGVRA
ncbi:MAG: CheR family methyltransferase [Hyphomicrobiaceae bacterium]